MRHNNSRSYMLTSFIATLNPMIMLLLYIIIGFTLGKTKILSDDAATVIAKLETWVLCPALSFLSMAKFFTVETIVTHAANMAFATVFVFLAITVGVIIAKFIIKKPGDERNIYSYVLTYGNYGYMGEPLILEIFGAQMHANFKMFCLPVTILVYTWGVPLLIPKGKGRNNALKSFFNPSTIAMFCGMIVGITGLWEILPDFVEKTLTPLGNCMGPIGMILLGLTVSSYKLLDKFKSLKIHLATILRLVILPALHIPLLYLIKEAICLPFGWNIGNEILIYAFFIAATPHGMNTIVFPKSYGGEPKTGASLAIISHVLAVLTIPLMFSLMNLLFF